MPLKMLIYGRNWPNKLVDFGPESVLPAESDTQIVFQILDEDESPTGRVVLKFSGEGTRDRPKEPGYRL